jgi:hypothetical protein
MSGTHTPRYRLKVLGRWRDDKALEGGKTTGALLKLYREQGSNEHVK